jgi:hypothetical protein
MEIVKQIKQICLETDNEWFLTHDFTKIALCDLQATKLIAVKIMSTYLI